MLLEISYFKKFGTQFSQENRILQIY